jgi:hypothetical protein
MPASAHKAASDVLPRNPEHLGQFPVSDPAFVERSGAVEVECRRDVGAVMRGLLHDREIGEPIVVFPPVDVVDMLRGEESASDVLGHDVPMLVDLPTIDADDLVTGGIQSMRLLPFDVAGTAAKSPLIGPDGAALPDEVLAARGTCEVDFHAL